MEHAQRVLIQIYHTHGCNFNEYCYKLRIAAVSLHTILNNFQPLCSLSHSRIKIIILHTLTSFAADNSLLLILMILACNIS